jgi:hypothetical protein
MDKTVKAWWNEFEKSLEIPQGFLDRQAEIIEASGWTKGVNGDLPGVFANIRRGSRALWSTKWSTSHGIVNPDDVWPLEFMSLAQLQAEIADNCWTRPTDPVVGQLTQQILELEYEPHNAEYWRKQTIKFLGQARVGYRDYVAPWDCPQIGSQTYRLMNLQIRPGWGLKEDYGF